MSTERNAALIARAHEGVSLKDLAEEFDLTIQWVGEILRKETGMVTQTPVEEVVDWDRPVWVRIRDTADARIAEIDSEMAG